MELGPISRNCKTSPQETIEVVQQKLELIEELPEGAFVCEYVGEILTNMELYERNKQSSGKDKHVYPVLLDVDWATEGVLKDEDAFCLDATYYGKVARFIITGPNEKLLFTGVLGESVPSSHVYLCLPPVDC